MNILYSEPVIIQVFNNPCKSLHTTLKFRGLNIIQKYIGWNILYVNNYIYQHIHFENYTNKYYILILKIIMSDVYILYIVFSYIILILKIKIIMNDE